MAMKQELGLCSTAPGVDDAKGGQGLLGCLEETGSFRPVKAACSVHCGLVWVLLVVWRGCRRAGYHGLAHCPNALGCPTTSTRTDVGLSFDAAARGVALCWRDMLAIGRMAGE